MEDIIVSVIVPCYNQASFLPEALNSVLEQTWQYWECIVVNDCSPDETSLVATAFCALDRRFKLLNLNSNGGLANARNRGIQFASGKFILPLDADDKIHPDYLNKCIKGIQSDASKKVVYTYSVYFGTENRLVERPLFSMKDLCRNNIFHATALFRRQDYYKTSGFRINMKDGYEDWDFWLQLLECDNQALLIPEYLFYYRQKENSMITQVKSNLQKHNTLKKNLYKNNRIVFQKWHPELAYWYEQQIFPGDWAFKIKYRIRNFLSRRWG